MTKFVVFLFITTFIAIKWVSSTSAYQFPIAELGNCRDQKECRIYCEVPDHKPACWSYAVYGVKENVLGIETPETKIALLGIRFPITELGNCENLSECKQYCDQSFNQSACRDFGNKNGLTNKEIIVSKAKEELPCATLDECKQFCEDETNRNQCQMFAKKYLLKKAKPSRTNSKKILQGLGCLTREECRKACEKNPSRCPFFPKKTAPATDSSGVRQFNKFPL